MKIKPFHIIALVVIAVGIGIILSTSGDASTYVCFAEARELAADGEDDKVHVVGSLPKDAVGKIAGMDYQPEKKSRFLPLYSD